jgi:3'-phosphoadenosine 5'-phosphosulfate sulfotransferase
MSHFTHIKTRFQNLLYLKKALNRLNISYKEKFNNLNSEVINLAIPQSNGYDIEFAWNGEQYELVVDMSFWQQSSPVESFIDKVAQTYAGEVIISESQKTGFQAIKYQQNIDGSNTLVLERWNHEKVVQSV